MTLDEFKEDFKRLCEGFNPPMKKFLCSLGFIIAVDALISAHAYAITDWQHWGYAVEMAIGWALFRVNL